MDWNKTKPKQKGRYLVTVEKFLTKEPYVSTDVYDTKYNNWRHYGDQVIAWADLPKPFKKA